MEVFYEGVVAGNSANVDADESVSEFIAAPGAEFQVFEVGDVARATPLQVKVGGRSAATIKTSDRSVMPDVRVTSNNYAHIFKSGTFEWERLSNDGMKKAVDEARAAAQLVAAEMPARVTAELEAAAAAGTFKGEPGQDGSNVVPTAQAIATEIQTPGTPANTALSATFGWRAPKPSGGDDGSALRADIAKAAAAGAREYRMNGDYLISSAPGLAIPAGITIIGRDGATRIRQGYSPGLFNGLVSSAGTFTDTNAATLTATVGARSTVLAVSSSAALIAGEYYMLGSGRAYADAPSSTSGDDLRYRGEIVRIASIDSSTQVTIHGAVRDTYSTADGASLRLISYASGVGMVDMILHNTAPGTRIGDLLKFSFVSDFLIDNVKFEQGDGCGIHLDTVRGGQVLNSFVEDLTDDIDNNRYGYGINVTRATEDVTIIGHRAERGRHAFTTNGVTGKRGVPRNIQIIGGISNRSNSAAWDTHVQGDNIAFLGAVATNCQVFGFSMRAPGSRVINAQTDFCGNGFNIAGTASGTHVKGGSFRRSVRNENFSQGRGGVLGSASGVLIEDNTIDGTWNESLQIYGGGNNNLIRSNTFRNPGVGGTPAPGIVVDATTSGSGNKILDNLFEAGASGGTPLSVGALTYPIDLAAPAATGWYVADNKAVGATQPVFVRDLGSGTVKSNNRHLDRAEGRSAGLAPAGVLAETYPRTASGISSQAYLASGRQSFVAVWLEAGQTVTSITFASGGTAAVAPTNQWFSLYDAARKKLAVTVDDTTTPWAAFAKKSLNLAAPYAVPTTGLYYLGITVAAGTVPNVGGLPTAAYAAGMTPKLTGYDGTNVGLTTPASAPATAAGFSDNSTIPYAQVA